MEATGRGIEIRAFHSDLLEDVFNLYERAWPGDVERRKTAFRWLHEGNPFRRTERSYLLAYKDGILAGYWGRMPMGFRFRGSPINCVFTQEALVDPAFRRQGIARALMEEATSPPELYLSLWHNERIVSLLESHGWKSVGAYHVHRRVYRASNLLSWKLRNPLLRMVLQPVADTVVRLRFRPKGRSGRVQVEDVERFADDLDRFYDEVAPRFGFIADRSSATLNWRFTDIPHRRFRRYVARDPFSGNVRGYVVVERTPLPEEGIVRGDIVDLLVAPGDNEALSALMEAADGSLKAAGADFTVTLLALPDFHAGLERCGYRKVRNRGPTRQLIYLDRRDKAEPPVSETYFDWFLTHSDSDGHLW